LQAAGGVFQNGFDLRLGHSWKPFDKLNYRGTVLDVIEQRAHGHARTAKYPGAARDARVFSTAWQSVQSSMITLYCESAGAANGGNGVSE